MLPRRSRAEIALMFDGLFARFASVSYAITEAFETVDPDLVICAVRGDNQVRDADRRYQNHYVMFVRFRAGEVASWTEYSDPNVYHRAVDGD
jgi:ketosteroid isomerase-like protein